MTPGSFDNDNAENWLRATVAAGVGLCWCGHGFSFAAAQTAAAIMRALGLHSYAVRPEELPRSASGRVGCFSRSGRLPATNVDLLVTQVPPLVRGRTSLRVLDVYSSDAVIDRWVPTNYTADAVCAVARALGVRVQPSGNTSLPFGDEGGDERIVLLFDEHADAGRAVLDAAAEKLGPLPIHAMTVHEFGHGFHSQVWRNPDKFRLWLCAPRGELSEAWGRLVRWCARVGVRTDPVNLGDADGSGGAALLTCLSALRLVDTFAEKRGVRAESRPVPIEMDNLRGRSAR